MFVLSFMVWCSSIWLHKLMGFLFLYGKTPLGVSEFLSSAAFFCVSTRVQQNTRTETPGTLANKIAGRISGQAQKTLAYQNADIGLRVGLRRKPTNESPDTGFGAVFVETSQSEFSGRVLQPLSNECGRPLRPLGNH